MNVVLKMWTPKGTMVEIHEDPSVFRDEETKQGAVIALEALWLQAGFTSQRPDHTYPVKEQVIEGIVVVDGTDFNGNPQKVLYLYTDNRNLEFSEYRVYPEDEWYPKLASVLDMDNSVGIAPQKSKLSNRGSGYQLVNRKGTFVPARNAEGQLVFRKDKNGERKSWPEYRIQSLEGFTNGNAPSPATNGNGAQRTQQAGATPDVTWDWKQLKAHYADLYGHEKHIDNTLMKLTRELFDVPKGQERAFITAATPDKIETLKAAFLSDADEKEAIMHGMNTLADMVDEGEEIPF